jgi:hypothetical protein
MAERRVVALGVALCVATLVLGGCSGDEGDDGSLDPAVLGRVEVDPGDESCVALEGVWAGPRFGVEPMPRAELAAVFARKDVLLERLTEIDPGEFERHARVARESRQVLLRSWEEDGTEVIERADLARMAPIYLASNEAIERGESAPTARDMDESRDALFDAFQECAIGDVDPTELQRGDEPPPAGFVLHRADPGDTSPAAAISTDGEDAWDVPGLANAALWDFRVSPDGTQVLADAFDRTDGSGVIVVADVDDLREPTTSPWRVLVEDDGPWGSSRWTSDGTGVISIRGPYTDRRLALVDIASGDVTDIADLGGWNVADTPGAVFDGRVILRDGAQGNVLRSLDLDSGETTTILELEHCAIADTIELDDDRLLLNTGCDDERANGVYSVRSDGSDLRALFTDIDSSVPRVSADGEWMAMNLADDSDSMSRPWIARVDGTEARPLGDDWAGVTTWIDN